jgi:hypothetical protein
LAQSTETLAPSDTLQRALDGREPFGEEASRLMRVKRNAVGAGLDELIQELRNAAA